MDDESYDCRYIRNVYLLKPLKDRALQELRKLNNPKQILYFDKFLPVININNICNVNVYVGITLPTIIAPNGRICTHVIFPNVHSIDDLINIFVSNIKVKFAIKESSIALYQNDESIIYRYQFLSTYLIVNSRNNIINNEKEFRIFNISTPEFNIEGVFVGFQFKNNSKMVHVVSFNNNNIDYLEFISHGFIQLPEVTKCNTVSKLHCFTNIFHKNHKNNRNEYKQLN